MTSIKRILPGALAGTILPVTGAAARRGVPPCERRADGAVNDLPDTLAPLVWPPMQFGSFPSPFVAAGVAAVS